MNEKEMQEKIEEMMDQQEQAALNIWKKEIKLEEAPLPIDVKEMLESAFLTGFNMGGIVEEENFKVMFKSNPTEFIKWMKEDK
ncbi:hypothetical protein KIOSHI_34 [Bacillus phage Kioshi]|nr:hypothetical protein KIOSHI_34 [Bacillus phage Kioshi]